MPTIHLDIDFSVLLRCTLHAFSTSWSSGEYEQGPQAPVLGRDHAPSLPLPTHRRGSDPRVGFPSAHSHYANPVQTLSAQRFPGLVTSLHDLREEWKSCGQHRHADHQHEHSSNRGYLLCSCRPLERPTGDSPAEHRHRPVARSFAAPPPPI